MSASHHLTALSSIHYRYKHRTGAGVDKRAAVALEVMEAVAVGGVGAAVVTSVP